MPFPYKHVLLTGATSGIGAAMADRLVQEGSKVVAVGRCQDRLDNFVRKHGDTKAGAERFDMSDRKSMDGFVQKVIQDYPDLDCVFLNAGIQSPGNLASPEKFDLDLFHTEVATNFTSVVEMTIKFLPFLQKKSSPTSIIFTNSNLAWVPAANLPTYSATKSALSSFILCLRLQLQGSSVKIIEVSPPPVQTELHDYMGDRGRSMGMPLDAFTNEAYASLASGKDQIIIGAIGDAGTFNEMVDKRRAATEKFHDFLQSQMRK
ncbi:MAG: hypothetical protein Q9220_005960 [cf. Caloplaca sp. 1 TL-2023]